MSKFEERFKQVYGEKVWENLTRYSGDFWDAETKFKFYIQNMMWITNFTKNKYKARMMLITLEKFYGENDIDFSKKLSSNMNVWETEHIIPVSRENIDKKYINSLGNLTLISRRLNGNDKYNVAEFETKKTLMEDYLEYNFYINDVFKKYNKFNEDDILEREQRLKEKFKNIFYDESNVFSLDMYFKKVLNYIEEERNGN